ncbi:MAG TPA: hypothetical protein DIT59_03930 [Leclercia sp.]|nr:hypothetical protein [Leclercia sp.]
MTISKAFTPTGLGGAHPAKGPLSVERLIRVRDELAAAAKRSDGGNLGYMMADGAKAVDELLAVRKAPQLPQPVPDSVANTFIAAIEKEQDRLHGEDYLMDSRDCNDVIREEIQRLNACRAAMLHKL